MANNQLTPHTQVPAQIDSDGFVTVDLSTPTEQVVVQSQSIQPTPVAKGDVAELQHARQQIEKAHSEQIEAEQQVKTALTLVQNLEDKSSDAFTEEQDDTPQPSAEAKHKTKLNAAPKKEENNKPETKNEDEKSMTKIDVVKEKAYKANDKLEELVKKTLNNTKANKKSGKTVKGYVILAPYFAVILALFIVIIIISHH